MSNEREPEDFVRGQRVLVSELNRFVYRFTASVLDQTDCGTFVLVRWWLWSYWVDEEYVWSLKDHTHVPLEDSTP